MRIPDSILKSVVFLCGKKKGEFVVTGTGFLIHHKMEGEDARVGYLVTARHVVDRLQDGGSEDTCVYIRANTSRGTTAQFKREPGEWFRHENDRVDIAISPCTMLDSMDQHHFGTEMFLTERTLKSEHVGLGDDLFFPGLFSPRKGETRNIPIVRTGTIAAMPGEEIKTSLGMLRAYLVEARSIGGLSGSPVFLHPGIARGNSGTVVFHAPKPKLYLLGMIHGHYGMGGELTDVCSEGDAFGRERSVNMGIGIVCPADDILALLNQPNVVRHREQAAKAAQRQQIKALSTHSPRPEAKA